MSHTHFTLESRIRLEVFLDEGRKLVFIAAELGVNPSSVSEELRRNKLSQEEYTKCRIKGRKECFARPKNKYCYSGVAANIKAYMRRIEANQCHHKLSSENTPLTDTIARYLKKKWPPETICAKLRKGDLTIDGVKRRVFIAVQTIYDWIYEFRRDLQKYLRRNHSYRHNRAYYVNKKKRKEVAAERLIDNRPEIVEKRTRIGDWEGDTVLGNNNGSTGRIATFVERRTGYLVAYLLPALTSKQKALEEQELELERLNLATRFADGAVQYLKRRIKSKYLKTLTLDNGSENTGYEWIERGIPELDVYFAHPYHSWERGTNENTNGILRQYFPKGLDFRTITQADVDKAVKEINNRPRKRLQWKSPMEKMRQNAALIPLKNIGI